MAQEAHTLLKCVDGGPDGQSATLCSLCAQSTNLVQSAAMFGIFQEHVVTTNHQSEYAVVNRFDLLDLLCQTGCSLLAKRNVMVWPTRCSSKSNW